MLLALQQTKTRSRQWRRRPQPWTTGKPCTTTIFCSTIFFFFVVEFSGRSKLHLGRSARNYVKVFFFFNNAQCTDLKFRQSVAVVVVTVVVAAITVVVVVAVVGVAHASQIVVSNGIPTPKLKTNAR